MINFTFRVKLCHPLIFFEEFVHDANANLLLLLLFEEPGMKLMGCSRANSYIADNLDASILLNFDV